MPNSFSSQSLSLYTPLHADLNLAPSESTQEITNSISSFFKKLTFKDLRYIQLKNNCHAYCICQDLGVLMWSALRQLGEIIVAAGTANTHKDSTLPVAIHSYIPQPFYRQLNLPRPEIFTVLNLSVYNGIYVFTSLENIQDIWMNLQRIAQETLEWIKLAREQSNLLGDGSAWKWTSIDTPLCIEYPTRMLLTNGCDCSCAPSFSEFNSQL
ncbi:hypothetical protein GALMADRAFT_76022 [Galerina marginata CBS 339.88]|uniref:Uncharacterized protein n=1 Tax=Galerina marginata (strain CBS 339.88) TaxID=685588 RepID=A0A067SSE2_GALM3|nr:hypothetical protein GALMADRAFT_76022 [Galerina marginata CBS 339.88]